MITDFALTDAEYAALEPDFEDLLHFAAWRHLRANQRNNHTDEEADLAQCLRLALITAGAYYKRQCLIEGSFVELTVRIDDRGREEFDDLKDRWANRRRHGNGRARFGDDQERQLDDLLRRYVPPSGRPDKAASLVADRRFTTYAKSVVWNTLKQHGIKTTREKPIRFGMASLSALAGTSV